jgi:hypothetical protein
MHTSHMQLMVECVSQLVPIGVSWPLWVGIAGYSQLQTDCTEQILRTHSALLSPLAPQQPALASLAEIDFQQRSLVYIRRRHSVPTWQRMLQRMQPTSCTVRCCQNTRPHLILPVRHASCTLRLSHMNNPAHHLTCRSPHRPVGGYPSMAVMLRQTDCCCWLPPSL